MVAKIKQPTKKEVRHNIFFSVVIAVFLFGVLGFLIVSNLRIGSKRTEMTNRIDELKQEISQLEERNTQLRAGIIETESDVYWEGKVREQGYKKEGEEAVVVLPPEEETEESIKEEKSLWQKITDFFSRE